MKTALVIGATGLVGADLVQTLLADDRFGKVKVFARRTTGLSHLKLEEHLVDFNAPGQWQHLVKGDVAFSALGTTLKQAGSKDAQYRVDYTYQLEFARAAATHAVPVFVLVSAAGADPGSRIFYSRMKGELENAVAALPFQSISFIRPGLLAGQRKETRPGEVIAYRVLGGINRLGLLRRYRPVPAHTVALALVNAALRPLPGKRVYTLEEVFRLAAEGDACSGDAG